MIAAIVLAAGASKRLGQPKQLVKLGGDTLIHRAIRTAREAGCAPIILVLGACHAEILAHSDLHHAIILNNTAWQEGMAGSIRLGLKAVPKKAEGTLLLTCDQPAVSAAHLQLLMAANTVAASSYAGRHGTPAYFPASMFADLMKLYGDTGARALLQGATAVDLPGGELDIDTAADLDQARLLFG